MENNEQTAAPVAATPSAEFFKELAAAQAEFASVIKNKVNPAFKSKYADLQAIFDSCRPALNRHGFFLFQKVTSDATSVSVETCLAHASGETLSSGILSVPYGAAGNRGANPAQAFGSARTYACRYSVSSFLCIAADDDDDGNGVAARQAPAPVQEYRLSQDQVNAAKNAAKDGMDAYKSFFAAQPNDVKLALTKSGYHHDCKIIAENADKGAAQ